MIGMFLCILVGFVCMIAAAGGYRAGWRQPVWIAWTVGAFLFLTVVPVFLALTIGLSPPPCTGELTVRARGRGSLTGLLTHRPSCHGGSVAEICRPQEVMRSRASIRSNGHRRSRSRRAHRGAVAGHVPQRDPARGRFGRQG